MELWSEEEIERLVKEFRGLYEKGKLEEGLLKLQTMIRDPRLPQKHREQIVSAITRVMMELPDKSSLRKNAMSIQPKEGKGIQTLIGITPSAMYFQKEIINNLKLKTWIPIGQEVVTPLELIAFALKTENGEDAILVLNHIMNNLIFMKGSLSTMAYQGIEAITALAVREVVAKFKLPKN